MRVLSMLGTALACGATAWSAQRSHRVELGGFGTYTRYDPIFGLESQFGGGGRLGFFLTNNIGVEVDGSVTRPAPTAGGPTTQVRFGSASLVINSGGPYILGGYSRLDMGVNPPYNFVLNAVHGGLGQRFFFSDRVALRIEARAYYPTSNPYFGGKKSLDATACGFFSPTGSPSASKPGLTTRQATRISAARSPWTRLLRRGSRCSSSAAVARTKRLRVRFPRRSGSRSWWRAPRHLRLRWPRRPRQCPRSRPR